TILTGRSRFRDEGKRGHGHRRECQMFRQGTGGPLQSIQCAILAFLCPMDCPSLAALTKTSRVRNQEDLLLTHRLPPLLPTLIPQLASARACRNREMIGLESKRR